MEEVPCRTSLAPLAFRRFVLCLIKVGSRRTFRLPGEGGDHFHCMVEPSPGHIWCRYSLGQTQFVSGILHSGSPVVFVPGTSPVCPGEKPGVEGRQKKSLCGKS